MLDTYVLLVGESPGVERVLWMREYASHVHAFDAARHGYQDDSITLPATRPFAWEQSIDHAGHAVFMTVQRSRVYKLRRATEAEKNTPLPTAQ